MQGIVCSALGCVCVWGGGEVFTFSLLQVSFYCIIFFDPVIGYVHVKVPILIGIVPCAIPILAFGWLIVVTSYTFWSYNTVTTNTVVSQ